MPDPWDEMNEDMARVEREARRDQEAAEAEAQQLHRASRTMTDVAWEAMQQGRTLQLRWAGGDFSGVPTAAVGDLIVIRTEEGAAAVNVPALGSIEAMSDKTEDGTAGDRTVESFGAWCRMVGGKPVRAHLLGGRTVEGTLSAVAADHLLIKTRHGSNAALARDQVVMVSVAGDPFLAL